MTTVTYNAWLDANQRYLNTAIERLRHALHRHPGTADEPLDDLTPNTQIDDAVQQPTRPFALDTLCKVFGLSEFERDVLLLCAGIELDGSFAGICADVQGDPRRCYPTLAMALAVLPDPHWSALTPNAPLRFWRLIGLDSGTSLVTSRVNIDERVLHYLTGLQCVDEQLVSFVQTVDVDVDPLSPSQQTLADAIADVWLSAQQRLPVIQLSGEDAAAKRQLAVMTAAKAGVQLYLMKAELLPSVPGELELLIRLWERETVLGNCALLLDCESLDKGDSACLRLVNHFLESIRSPILVATNERRSMTHREVVCFDVHRPTTGEQRVMWHDALGDSGAQLNGQINRLASQFDLNAGAIRAICRKTLEVQRQGRPADGFGLEDRLWAACRTRMRPKLDDLGQRIEVLACWQDLVLPLRQLETLRELAVQVRQRAKVYEEWGFAKKSARGLGISALFAGPSGTGKTMAAEVLANELSLDLYRIDLSQVVSKYIGETEKNLKRVFDAAEGGGAILLFDEADALFGRRSEVKDSHDRYANIEVSYLLQRIEAYRGLAILTTNLKDAIDDAFMRRIRFSVSFPFPGINERADIWRQVFPSQTPTNVLNVEQLAQLNVTGGNIRNIALHAAFLAAEDEQSVGMGHLLRAARREYAKLEKPLADTEIRGWQ